VVKIDAIRRALPPSICNVLDKLETMIAMLKKTNLMSAFCVLFMLGTGMSQANAALEIVAKVNGKAITNYQVDQRAAFLRMVTNLEDTAENRAQIKQDATQMLIDEILKLMPPLRLTRPLPKEAVKPPASWLTRILRQMARPVRKVCANKVLIAAISNKNSSPISYGARSSGSNFKPNLLN
jgi:hypothetical protein